MRPGREKDLSYAHSLAKHGMTLRDTLLERLAETSLDAVARDLADARIDADFIAT